MEKLSSMKLVPGAKKVDDCCPETPRAPASARWVLELRSEAPSGLHWHGKYDNASGAAAKGRKGHDFSEQRSQQSLREREGLTPVCLEAVGAHGDRKSGLLSLWSGSSCLLCYIYSFWSPWVLHRLGRLRLGPPDQGSVGPAGGSLAW